MDRKQPAPVTRPAPVTVPGVTVTGPGNAGTDPVTGPVTDPRNAPAVVAVTPITMPERVGAAVRRLPGAVAKAVRELWFYPDRLIHSMWNGRPESMAAHYAYMTSFAWVPEEVTGKKATAWKWAGIAYHVFIAWPLKALAKALDAAAGRPLLMLCAVVPVLVLVLLFVL